MNRTSVKSICIILSGTLAILWASAASGTELYIPALTAKSGATVEVPIKIDRVDNLAGVKLVLKYEKNILTFKKAARTKQTSSLMHIVNDKKPGILIVVMAGARGIKGKDFAILSLLFDLKKGLKSNHTGSHCEQLKYGWQTQYIKI